MLSAIYHLMRFVIVIPVPKKVVPTIALTLIDRVFSVFGIPELLYYDQGTSLRTSSLQSCNLYSGTRKLVPHHTGCKVITF